MDFLLKWPKFPSDIDELHEYAMDFKLSRKPQSPFNGCIGALNGVVIKIWKPKELEDAEFYCLKGFFRLKRPGIS